jgi:hypothetical protein
MVIALPVESQPLWIQIPMVLLTIAFGGWVARQAWLGLKQWQQPSTHVAIFTLSCFTLCVVLQFVAIIYLLGKDITVAPRYNFVYYPAVCALLGACYAFRKPNGKWVKALSLSIALLSCVFVVSNLVFLKPFHPQQVARDMRFEPSVPIMMVMGYSSFQDVALGLSFALAIDQLNPSIPRGSTNASFAFLNTKLGYEPVWQNLSKLPVLQVPRLNLWVVAPGLRRKDYPPQLILTNQTRCTLDPNRYHRIGIPYQLYQCNEQGR